MGFDNECIINIQSLAGEYFCPVCRLLVYPNEALQSQCTHLYCKPCLTYIVSTTRACPYDGYLVTEADSKPLIETNKALGETIGKVTVHCLYHRSGCTWQGPLSECTSHCSGCAFGNSPVVCNRCGIQIVHRQVQEHAQNCPGVQTQVQQADSAQEAAAAVAATGVDQMNVAPQAGTATSQVPTSQTTSAPTPGQDPNQQVNSNPQAQAIVQPGMLTPEQWYQQQQQQYQQYYQQYPGYDPYQQQYQQYYPYQQQAVSQYQQAHPPHVGQQQLQPYMQPQQQQQPQVHSQAQAQAQPQALPQPPSQPQTQPHAQPQLHPHIPGAVAAQHQPQAQVNTQHQLNPAVQPHLQIQSQTNLPPQGHQNTHPQPYSQAQPHPQPHPMQPHPQQHPQMPQYQQPHTQMQHAHRPQHHPPPQPQPQSQPHSQAQPQAQVLHQPQSNPQPSQLSDPNAQPQTQNLSVHSVTGHQSYQQTQPPQQMQLGVAQPHLMHMQSQGGSHPQLQHPVQMHGQFPQQPQMRPPLSQAPQAPTPNQQQPALLPSPGQVPNAIPAQQQPVHPHAQQPGHPSHQRPVIHPVQQSIPQQYVQPHQPFPGQPLHQQSSFVQQQPMLSQLGPPHSLPQHSHSYSQPQQNLAQSQGMPTHQSKNHTGRPMLPNLPYPHSAGGGLVRQLGANQSSVNQSNLLRTNSQVQFSEQQSGTNLKPAVSERHMFGKNVSGQEAESSSQKTAKLDAIGLDISGSRAVAGETKSLKSENNGKSMDGEHKPIGEVDAKSSLVDTSSKEVQESIRILGTEPKHGEPVSKQMVKGEPFEGSPEISRSEGQKDVPSVAHEKAENSALEDKKIQEVVDAGGTVLRSSGSDEALQTLPSASVPLSDSYAQNVVSKGVIPGSERTMFHQHDASQAQPQQIQYGPSSFQQRPGVPAMFQGPPPGGVQAQRPGHIPSQFRPQGPVHIPHPGQPLNPPEHFHSPIMKQPYGPEIPAGGVPGSFGRGSSHYGHPVAPQGPYNQGQMPPSYAGPPRTQQDEAVGGLPLGVLPPGAFDSHSGMMARGPPHVPEGRMGLQHPTNPIEADMFPRRPGVHSDMTRMNGAPSIDASSSLGLRDGRFKALSDERLNPLPVDPARHISDRGGFEEDLKQFPMPSHMDSEPGSKFGSYLPSSRSLDKVHHGFGMDKPFVKGGIHGHSVETGRSFPPYHHGGTFHPNDARDRAIGLHEDMLGGSDNAHTRPDFYGPGPGYGRRHMDGLAPRSPVRERPGISRGLKGLPGGQLGLEDIDGRESQRFGEGSKSFNLHLDPIGNSFHESRFPALPGHLRRGDFEGPGNLRMVDHFRSGNLIGQDNLPSHLRRGEHLGPRHLRLGDPIGFGAFPGQSWMGELSGPGRNAPHLSIDESFGGGSRTSHPRLGEPGFRSSYSLQGDLDSFDNSRRRKPASMGWCRICKIDCETVEGLEMHSQTREHQKIAMDLVRSIKQQNAKKQKLTSSDHSSLEDTSKSRNVFEGRGNKH